MSLRYEQYHSLEATKEFLGDLIDRSKTPKVPMPIRERASRCLRHFPFLDENGKPTFSKDEFGPDSPPKE